MIRQEMKVGPKGQIVIPKIFREHKKIYPGDRIFVELREDSIIIEKSTKDALKVFEEISKKGKPISVNSDSDYDQMMKERWKKHT
ncbi:AbrB/MazE/SpoVT family DNA-binding domain-containing protein [Candidatus Woesearchaeota archaeon]|nr:AbrB/MazE/SpoVT family DNA-binding domain-containing protein [Candidatus Woesearchaeota archaeon]